MNQSNFNTNFDTKRNLLSNRRSLKGRLKELRFLLSTVNMQITLSSEWVKVEEKTSESEVK